MPLSRLGRHLSAVNMRLVGCVAVGVVVGVGLSLWPNVSAQQGRPFQGTKFYLTTTLHDGANALTACANDFHMASIWEIVDPSNLQYDTRLGTTTADSGSGPPSFPGGWIRTGGSSSATTNCSVWSSNNPGQNGNIVLLPEDDGLGPWNGTGVQVSPWLPGRGNCSTPFRVWCVQDRP
jgi:hypothetical protein